MNNSFDDKITYTDEGIRQMFESFNDDDDDDIDYDEEDDFIIDDTYEFSDSDTHIVENNFMTYCYDREEDCFKVETDTVNIMAWREDDGTISWSLDLVCYVPTEKDKVQYVSIDSIGAIAVQYDTEDFGIMFGLTNPETGEASRDRVISLDYDTAYIFENTAITLPYATQGLNYTFNAMECLLVLSEIEDTELPFETETKLIHDLMHGAKKNRPLMRDAYDFIKTILSE